MQSYPSEDIQPVPAVRTTNRGHLQFAEDKGGLWSSGNSTNVSLSVNQPMKGGGLYANLARHFQAEIDTRYADIVLIVCGFVSGLVDGLSFNAWGSFSSMQTGTS